MHMWYIFVVFIICDVHTYNYYIYRVVYECYYVPLQYGHKLCVCVYIVTEFFLVLFSYIEKIFIG